MLEGIKSFFARHAGETEEPGEAASPEHRLHVAACALLLELAHADDDFSPEERTHIERAVVHHFDLPIETARELIELAEQEREEATDLFQFTSLINAYYDEGQRMVLAEVLWRVVYADGKLSAREDTLMRKLANLLELRPGYLAEARKRAVGERR
jgi:uncharacterized tellurite resistance protein B-like protein